MRLRRTALSGTLDAAVLAGDSTLSSPEFADLPVVASPDFLPLILDPGDDPEIAWVYDHTAAATTVQVYRGVETDRGAAVARDHADGTAWAHGPTPAEWDDEHSSAFHTTTADVIHLARTTNVELDGADVRFLAFDAGISEVFLVLLQGAGGGVLDLACQGAWDPSTNTPTLADGVGAAGDFCICTTSDSVDTGAGAQAYTAGQYAVYGGTVWAPSATTPGGGFHRVLWEETGDYSMPTLSAVADEMDVFRLTSIDPSRFYWLGQRVATALPFTY